MNEFESESDSLFHFSIDLKIAFNRKKIKFETILLSIRQSYNGN